MPVGYYSDVVKILKKHGFELAGSPSMKYGRIQKPERKVFLYPEKLKVAILPIAFSMKQVLIISYN